MATELAYQLLPSWAVGTWSAFRPSAIARRGGPALPSRVILVRTSLAPPSLEETRLVAGLERNLGRRAQPFQLRITVIPVSGKELWQLDPQNVLLTDELLRDPAEYRARITPVVQALL